MNTTTYTYYSYNARLFVALAPYRRKILTCESATRGWPLLRAPVMYHPTDLVARRIRHESFYLGPDLYVAPVLDARTFALDVYLPGGEGTFTHVWSGTRYTGGQHVTVATPYGKPAVFVVNDAETPELESFWAFVRRENGTVLSV
ncbi:glycoside hydrolase family 31 protein [Teratosphaeria destructans]|uniref:Glycoside hydrolase family 31 protein n=1 Tax=Teratosphaeria destructans TaxID=418781 RepID=A0A9W7W174_9PEZI|nr:glycoside hydrolase family 31 protein [Teratosphaeria destructans]